eukprot:TRINITY_DN584_c1_g1_i1.p1 TRINITY_DN584_c1_g1~~TRINITY_DN584_c1_g1_i1.p1  ORF type:complete len:409 (+),score=51.31 TRINITY_DN584_c1_g1_i1:928-2154(+)
MFKLLCFLGCIQILVFGKIPCVKNTLSSDFPSTMEDGPILVTDNYIYAASGSVQCSNNDMWRFDRKTLNYIDSIQSDQCDSFLTATRDATGNNIYVGGRNGFVYRIDTKTSLIKDTLRVPLAQVTNSFYDDDRSHLYVTSNKSPQNSTIVRIDTNTFKVDGTLVVPQTNIGQIAPILHPNKKEVLYFGSNSILRVNLNSFKVSKTIDFDHGFVFAISSPTTGVVSVDRSKLSLIDLDTFELVPSALDTLTESLGTPWLIHITPTGILYTLYDLGSFAEYKYKYQIIDMSNPSHMDILEEGDYEGPNAALIQKIDSGSYDRSPTSIYLRFYSSTAFEEVSLSNCKAAYSTNIISQPDIASDPVALSIIIVGSCVGSLLVVVIGIGLYLISKGGLPRNFWQKLPPSPYKD